MKPSQQDMANAIRFLSADAIDKANSGHPGIALGMADVATVLFTKFLKFDTKHPRWADRDRFILSAGHGSMLLYSALYLTGYEDITIDDIKNMASLRGDLPLITTFKDYVKLPAGWQEYITDNFYMLEIEMHLNNDGIEDLKEIITP